MVTGDKRYFNTDCAFYYEWSIEYSNVPSCLFRYEHSTTHETDDTNGCRACPYQCPAYVKRSALIDNAIAEKMKDVPADYDFVAAEKEALGEVDILDNRIQELLNEVEKIVTSELNEVKAEVNERIQDKIYKAIKGVN